MNKFKLILLMLLLFSCRSEKSGVNENEGHQTMEIIKQEFQQILDSAFVTGAIVIYDAEKDTWYSNDFTWARKGQLPASTYKIPNSLIAIETRVVKDDSTLFFWDGSKRALKNWEQDLIFRDAFHLSCVPCYQEVARKIGSERMNKFIQSFQYGNLDIDSTNIDQFWLRGKSRISPMEQIDFLRRFYHNQLPITSRTDSIMRKMMVTEKNENYTLSGKTGWSNENDHDNGWFVGYLETSDNVIFFATNVEPLPSFNMNEFAIIRKTVTMDALRKHGLMEIN